MKHTTRIAALASVAAASGITLASLAWPSATGAQSTNPIDQPSTWFVACPNDRGHDVLGGRMLTNGKGYPIELVGPVAVTLAGAIDFAHQAEDVFGVEVCDPVHLNEVWMLSIPWGPTGIGEAAELSR